MKWLKDKLEAIIVICIILLTVFGVWASIYKSKKWHNIVKESELKEKRLNDTIDLLIEEYHEEKRSREVCEEAVSRWAGDARTRQEVKNEARRLMKKEGKNAIQ